MKKLIYLLLLPLVVAVTACGGKVNSKKESVLATQDSVDARGIQRMQTSKSEIDIKFKGKDYRSFVSRTPDESLPHVTNEMGDTYMDNKIVLRLTRGGESVFNKTFTKNDFSSVAAGCGRLTASLIRRSAAALRCLWSTGAWTLGTGKAGIRRWWSALF